MLFLNVPTGLLNKYIYYLLFVNVVIYVSNSLSVMVRMLPPNDML